MDGDGDGHAAGGSDETQVAIRPATAGDFDAFVAVYESIAAEGRWIGGELPVDWDRRRPLWDRIDTDDRLLVLLAEAGGRPIGWISADHGASGVVDIGMGIVDGWRGRGVGTALLDRAMNWARSVGGHKVALSVWPHNSAGRALYEKFGFEVEGRRRRHWRRRNGELWDDIVMGRVLDDTAPGSPYAGADADVSADVAERADDSG